MKNLIVLIILFVVWVFFLWEYETSKKLWVKILSFVGIIILLFMIVCFATAVVMSAA